MLAQTEDEVWPAGDNGPQVWPPELNNPFWQAEMRYPEGGDPPPLDYLTRLKCPMGSAKLTITQSTSAPWEQSRHHPPEYAFDNYTMSRWSTGTSADNWIVADMATKQTVVRVYLTWEVAHGTDYDLRISDDGQAFTTVKEIRGGNGQADVIDLTNASGRYLRMEGLKVGNPSYGYSLYDFTICALDGSPVGGGGAGGTAGISGGGAAGADSGGAGGVAGEVAGIAGTGAPVNAGGGAGASPGQGGTAGAGAPVVTPLGLMAGPEDVGSCSVSRVAGHGRIAILALGLGAGVLRTLKRRRKGH